MAHDDPFTIDLFGNTALASGFDLGMPGFAAEFGTDLDDDRPPSTPAPAVPVLKIPETKLQMRAKVDFRLEGSHGLAKSWRDRARDNIGAILLTNEIECQGLPARPDQQAKLIRFTGFGASDLASGIFRRPGEDAFRKGWEELGGNLESAVAAADYASLARCTQFAHFTPEFIVRAIWAGLIRLGNTDALRNQVIDLIELYCRSARGSKIAARGERIRHDKGGVMECKARGMAQPPITACVSTEWGESGKPGQGEDSVKH